MRYIWYVRLISNVADSKVWWDTSYVFTVRISVAFRNTFFLDHRLNMICSCIYITTNTHMNSENPDGYEMKIFQIFSWYCKKSKCWYSFVRSNDISTHVFCLELKYILNNTPKVSNMEKLMVFRRTDNLTIFNKRERRKLWSLKQTVSKLQCLKKV